MLVSTILKVKNIEESRELKIVMMEHPVHTVTRIITQKINATKR